MSLINKVSFALLVILSACGEDYEWQGPVRPTPFNKECTVDALPIGEWCSEWKDGVWSSCGVNRAGGIMCCSTENGCYQR